MYVTKKHLRKLILSALLVSSVCTLTIPSASAATQYGGSASATGTGAAAYGENAKATGAETIAIGYNAKTVGEASITIGSGASIDGGDTTIKNPSYNAIAIGAGATITRGENTPSKNAIALGYNATASYHDATAIGANAIASNQWSTALGNTAAASGYQSTAAGYNAKATYTNAAAFGAGASASTDGATALGGYSIASGKYAVAVGKDSIASGEETIALGHCTEAKSTRSTALGSYAHAYASSATAVGFYAQATGKGSTASGYYTDASGDYSSAYGYYSNASGTQSLAVGLKSTSSGDYSSALGNWSAASGKSSIAAGYNTQASGDYSAALGRQAQASGTQSLAIGLKSTSSGDYSSALGSWSAASGESSIAAGYNTQASGDYSSALGRQAQASGAQSSAIGYNAISGGTQSMALGANSYTAADNEISFGHSKGDTYLNLYFDSTKEESETNQQYLIYEDDLNRKLTHVADGTIAENSKDAVNGGQLYAVKYDIEKNAYKGWKVSTNKNTDDVNPTIKEVSSDGTVDFSNSDKNITISQDGTDIDLKLADKVTIGSPEGKKVTINGETGTVNGLTNTTWDENYQITSGQAATEDQLKAVSDTANKGWNISANGKEAANVAPGATVDFSNTDDNIVIGRDGTNITTKLADDVKINKSLSAADGKFTVDENGYIHNANGKTSLQVNDKVASLAYGTNTIIASDTGVELNSGYNHMAVSYDGTTFWDNNNKKTNIKGDQVSIGNTIKADGTNGVITGLTNTTIDYQGFATTGKAATEEQLKAVSDTANKGWNISANGEEAANVAPGATVDFSNTDDNIVIGRDGTNITTKLADDVTINKSLSAADGKFTVDENGYIHNANGKTSLQVNDKVASLAYGTNTIIASDTGVELNSGYNHMAVSYNGTTFWDNNNKKTNIKGDQVSIGNTIKADGTNGVITGLTNTTIDYQGFATTGKAATEEQLAAMKKDIEDNSTDTHVKAGTYSVDANGNVTLDMVDKNGNVLDDKVTISDVAKASDVGNVSKIASDIQNKEGKTTVVDAVNNLNDKVGDLNYSTVEKGDIADGDSSTTAIGKLSQKLSDVETTAKAHNTVSNTDGNIIIAETENADKGTNYEVGLNKEKIDLGNVTIEGNNGKISATTMTTGDTSMTTDGIKVGDTASLTKNAVTIGTSSLTTDTLKVGGNTYIDSSGINANSQKITNIANGEVSETSADAINGSQLYQTNQQVINNSSNISNIYGNMNKLDSRIKRVGAGAAALAALHPLDFDPDGKWEFAAGYGNYRGANAVAIGTFYRPNEDTMFSVGGSFGGGENMVNAGVTFRIGESSTHLLPSRTQMAATIQSQSEQLAQQSEEIKEIRAKLDQLLAAQK